MSIADRSLSRLRGSPLPGAGCWGHLTCVWLVHPARCVRLGSLSHGGTCPLPATAPGRSNAPTRDDGQAPGPIPSGTANPNAPRRHSRRSRTRPDKRAHARRMPNTQPNPKRHSQPQKRTGGIAAAAATGWINAPTRGACQALSPIPSGTANPKAHRRHSRRSCIQLDKRTYARHRPIAQSNPKRHSQPKRAPAAKPPQLHPVGQTHLRETQTNRPAQTQAAQPTPKRPGGEAAAAATGWINAAVQD